jgi:hypothetical protein
MSDYTLPWLIWTQGIAIATAVVVGRWAVNRLRGREAVALVVVLWALVIVTAAILHPGEAGGFAGTEVYP